MRTFKKIFFTLIALFIVGVLVIHFYVMPTPEDFPTDKFTSPILIAHAGGAINGQTYTNSREAVEQSLSNKMEFIELDFIETTDGKLAAMHTFEDFNDLTGFGRNDSAVYAKDFRSRRIGEDLHPLLLEDVKQLFAGRDAVLVTDKSDDFDALLELANTDQLIVEVFGYRNYAKALRKGIKYPILEVYHEAALERNMKYLKLGKVKMITIPTRFIDEKPELIKELHDRGIVIFAITSNDINYVKKYGGTLVSGFYTDSLTVADLE